MAGDQAYILIIDDNAELQETLADFLQMEGYETASAANVDEARTQQAARPADLILLDLNMPGVDGLTYAAELRSASAVPILMMSGKGAMIDRVVGLEVGADDYLPKPFELRELLARVRALLRRTSLNTAHQQTVVAAVAGRTATIGHSFSFLPSERRLCTPDDQTVELTGAEYHLLEVFVERPGRVLSRAQIADLVQGDGSETFDRSIDTLVSRLRKKLSAHAEGDMIQTVRGEGYVFAAPVKWSGEAVD